MENKKLKRKIYICNAGNGQFGRSHTHNLYMSSDQVDQNRGKIRRDKAGDPFIYMGDLSRDDYYDEAKMRQVANEFGVSESSLWEILDWQYPETLAAELGDHEWPF